MRVNFVKHTFRYLFDQDVVAPSDRLLVVGGTDRDAETLFEIGFSTISIININPDSMLHFGHKVNFIHGDISSVQFEKESFDVTFTSDCLHHCSSPHGALIAMYRAARKAMVVIESRDNWLMRLGIQFGFTNHFELNAKNMEGHGGVDYTSVPNFIYRWTEREFEKTIQSADPTIKHKFFYRYALTLPEKRFNSSRSIMRRWALSGVSPLARAISTAFPRQGNTFAMAVLKDPDTCELRPWLERVGGEVRPRAEYYAKRGLSRAGFAGNWTSPESSGSARRGVILSF